MHLIFLIMPAAFNASGKYCTPEGLNPRIEGASMTINLEVKLCSVIHSSVIYSDIIMLNPIKENYIQTQKTIIAGY
jgi:hypothetical protein